MHQPTPNQIENYLRSHRIPAGLMPHQRQELVEVGAALARLRRSRQIKFTPDGFLIPAARRHHARK